jgi:hypothetical protein
MATLPKTSVEILAAANLSQKERQPWKLKTNLKIDFKTLLSTFSVNPSAETSCAAPSLPLQSSPITSNVFSISSTYLNNPIIVEIIEMPVITSFPY